MTMPADQGGVVVTGAGRGIGRALTELLVARGRPVVALDCDLECISSLSEDLGDAVLALVCDVTAAAPSSIVNVASIHSLVTVPGMFPYAAAKSGVVGLSRTLAMDLGPRNIRVNAISPGWTRTRLVQDWFDLQDDPIAAERSVLAAHPMGRMAEPEEIAEAIAFLLSPASSAITGTELRTDVGLSGKMAT